METKDKLEKNILSYSIRPTIAIVSFYAIMIIFTLSLTTFFGEIISRELHNAILVNIFLAAIPLILTYCIVFLVLKKVPKIFIFLVGFVWLLFFPNAFYMITDMIHSQTYNFFDNIGYAQTWVPWVGLCQLFMSAFIGCNFGFLSLFMLQKTISIYSKKCVGWVFSIACLSLSGVAIFLGRVLRFNSWNLFTHPRLLLATLQESVSIFSLVFILLFAGFFICMYLVVYSFLPKLPTQTKDNVAQGNLST